MSRSPTIKRRQPPQLDHEDLSKIVDTAQSRWGSLAARFAADATRSAGASRRAAVGGSAPAAHEAQLWSWALAAGERYDAEPDPAGRHEMVVVTEGMLRIERDEGPITLAPGDYAIYSSAQTYAYVNLFDGVTRFTRVVVS